MIDGYAIMDKINEEIMNFHMPKYHIYFYKGKSSNAEKVDSYSLENPSQMNQLKMNIRDIISEDITYEQYTNYQIELFYINHNESFDHISTLREFYTSEEKELLEDCVGQSR